MTLQQLEYVLALAEHQHFGRAAQATFVTQPTLSQQVQKLESELDSVLFDRSKNPVQPTAAGEIVIRQARRVLAEGRMISESIAELKGELVGELRIGVIPTAAPFILPYFLTQMTHEHHGVKLSVREMPTDEIVQRLHQEDIDLGILALPLDEPGLIEEPLFVEPFMAFVCNTHPLSSAKTLQAEEIENEEIWLMAEGHCFRDQALQVCHSSKPSERLEFSAGQIQTLIHLVKNSGGITLLPSLAAEWLSAEDQQYLRPLTGVTPVRSMGLMYARKDLKKRLRETVVSRLGHHRVRTG